MNGKYYTQTNPWVVNYDEKRIPPYTLPDLLTCYDGRKIETAEEWMTYRRGELLEAFREYMYGKEIPLPDHTTYEVLEEMPDVHQALGTRRQIKLTFTMDDGRSHSAIMLLYLPVKKRANGKSPVFVGLTFDGNHGVEPDPAIIKTGSPQAMEQKPRGSQYFRFPLDYLLWRGYAVAVVSYHDFFRDEVGGWQHSIFDLFYPREQLAQGRLEEYSAIGAWSWGISRMMDYLETVPEIDPEKAVVFGHSRLGKTALWTGVRDERFKLICVNDSGCGGAALSRRLYGETLYSMHVYSSFAFWFCGKLAQYALTPEKLPLDQHALIALAAPRSVAVHSATLDQWADPTSEYLSAYHAGPVYRLFGLETLTSENPPPPDTPVGTDISYFCRTGGHSIIMADFEHYLNRADALFGKV